MAHWVRRFSLITMILTLAALLPAAITASAQSDTAGVTGNAWEGPRDGAALEWDAAIWEVKAASSDEHGDRLTLGRADGGKASITVTSFKAYDGDAARCLVDTVGDAFEHVDEVSDFAYLPDLAQLPSEMTTEEASTAFSLTYTPEDGSPRDYVFFLACYALVPGERAILIQVQASPDDWETVLPDAQAVLETLQLPKADPLPPIDAQEPSGDGGAMPIAGGDAARSGNHAGPAPDGAPEPSWQTKLDLPKGPVIGWGVTAPTVADGIVYVGVGYGLEPTLGAVVAHDAATGDELWRYPTQGAVRATPTVADGIVYAGSDDGFLYALDARTAERRWVVDAPYQLDESPAVVDGVVYLTDGHDISAFDAATGERRWRTLVGSNSFPAPAVAGGTVFVGSAVYDKSGNNGVYSLVALDAETGEPSWNVEFPDAIHHIAVGDGVVYVSSIYGFLVAVDLKTHEPLWEFRLNIEKTDSNTVAPYPPFILGDQVVISANDGGVHGLDAATGEEAWSFAARGEGYDNANIVRAVADGLVVATAGDVLIAIDPAQGEAAWETPLGGMYPQGLAVVDGAVYVSIADRDTNKASLTALGGDAGASTRADDSKTGSTKSGSPRTDTTKTGSAKTDPASRDTGASGATNEGGAYESPTYGYTIAWDPGVWSVVDESSADGADTIDLTNGTTNVRFTGSTFASTVKSCLRGAATALLEDPGYADFVQATEDDGTPWVRDGVLGSYTVFSNGPTSIYLECAALPDGGVLVIHAVSPADDFETGIEAVVELLRNVEMQGRAG